METFKYFSMENCHPPPPLKKRGTPNLFFKVTHAPLFFQKCRRMRVVYNSDFDFDFESISKKQQHTIWKNFASFAFFLDSHCLCKSIEKNKKV